MASFLGVQHEMTVDYYTIVWVHAVCTHICVYVYMYIYVYIYMSEVGWRDTRLKICLFCLCVRTCCLVVERNVASNARPHHFSVPFMSGCVSSLPSESAVMSDEVRDLLWVTVVLGHRSQIKSYQVHPTKIKWNLTGSYEIVWNRYTMNWNPRSNEPNEVQANAGELLTDRMQQIPPSVDTWNQTKPSAGMWCQLQSNEIKCDWLKSNTTEWTQVRQCDINWSRVPSTENKWTLTNNCGSSEV